MTQQGEEEAGEGQSRWRKDRGGRQGTEQRTRKHRLPGGKRGCWVPLFAQRSPLGAPYGAEGKEGAGCASSASRVKRAVQGPPITGRRKRAISKLPASFQGPWLPHKPPLFQSLRKRSWRPSRHLTVGEGLSPWFPFYAFRGSTPSPFWGSPCFWNTSSSWFTPPPPFPRAAIGSYSRKAPRLTWTQFWPLYSPG